MGMYTEFHFRAHLKEDGSAAKVMEWLDNLHWESKPFDDHPLFSSPRWQAVFNGAGACYQFARPMAVRYVGEDRGPWDSYSYNELLIHSSLKNYGNEIELFLDWIRPYIDARYGPEFIGYSLYEEDVEPKLYYSGALVKD